MDILFQKRKKFAGAFVFPTVDGYLMIFHISSENNLFTPVRVEPMAEQLRILHCNTSPRHHLRTALKSYNQILIALHSTTEVYNQRRAGSNLFQRTIVHHVVGSRSVKIHYMQAAYSVSLEFLGHFHRILVVHLLTVIISLGKANAFPVDNVNSRNNFNHLYLSIIYFLSRKFLKILSPAAPLFSG